MSPSSCIITDNVAQFTRVNFPDNIPLRFIDFKTEYSFLNSKEKLNQKEKEFPKLLDFSEKPIIYNPESSEIQELIENSVQNYDDVFVLLHSKELNPVYSLITDLLAKIRGRAVVHIIDSQSISIGQGYLIQTAIEMLSANMDGNLVEQHLREQIPHVYTLLCTPGLSYLQRAGFIDIGQSISGEILSILPIFSLEEGKFNPVDKLKNMHGVVEYFIEYIDEFDDLLQVSFLQSTPPAMQESRIIKQYIEENYPETVYSEHPHNNYLASLIGPKGFGLVVIEKAE
jgi:DegV family protein with EDD domain